MDQCVILEFNGYQCTTVKRESGNYGEGSTYIRDCTYDENVAFEHNMHRFFFSGGGGYYIWRPGGYYKIKGFDSIDIYAWKNNDKVAIVDYKPHPEAEYGVINDPLRLQPLFNYHSRCVNSRGKEFYKANHNALIGKEIHILSVDQVPYNNSVTYKVIWRVIGEEANNSFQDDEDFDPGEMMLGDEDFDPADLRQDDEDFDPSDYTEEDRP